MTAFLSIEALRVPACRRDVLRPADASRPVGWLITLHDQPIHHWRPGNKAPELPPG
jgi:hypothetical protein